MKSHGEWSDGYDDDDDDEHVANPVVILHDVDTGMLVKFEDYSAAIQWLAGMYRIAVRQRNAALAKLASRGMTDA